MFTKSIWNAFAQINSYPTLSNNITVDTAIIGGGITGLATAIELAGKGQQVAVLEALKIGGGTTSHSTGNLYVPLAQRVEKLREKYDADVVAHVLQSRQRALDRIAYYVEQYGIDCDFVRQPWYLYATQEQTDIIEKELKAIKEAGFAASEAAPGDIPLDFAAGIKLADQVQCNPMRLAQGMAAEASKHCQLYECTSIKEISEREGTYILTTENGHTVTAKHVVHATHSPKGVSILHTLLGPYREYCVACKINNELPGGIFWGYHGTEADKYSTRTYSRDGEHFVMVIGKPHKVGQQTENEKSIQALEDFARKHFDVQEVVYRWGGQHYRPADLLPYIGRQSAGSEVYLATGFSTDGLVWGVLAGIMFSDMITGQKNAWEKLYDPNRINPGKSAKEFVKENLNVAGQILKDYLKVPEDNLSHIPTGEGDVVEVDGDRVAAYKDEAGQTHLCSAVCPHLGCIVHWNKAEKTWDCPCHGSRFNTDGTLLEGPSFEGLKKIG